MKLIRWGAKGAEKPGLVDGMGVPRDLSGKIGDITSDLLSPEGLSRLAGIDPAGLPVIAERFAVGRAASPAFPRSSVSASIIPITPPRRERQFPRSRSCFSKR